MIAVLLYLIGLVSAVVTVVLVGFDMPPVYTDLIAAYNAGIDSVVPALARATAGLSWALFPFLGGLLLMGFARIMMLLAAIRHGLKGPARYSKKKGASAREAPRSSGRRTGDDLPGQPRGCGTMRI